MITEFAANLGQRLIGTTPPDGKDYWAARFWDRDAAEQHPVLRGDFLRQKDTIRRYLTEYGGEAKRSLEFACGTGEFTKMTKDCTPVAELVALDVSVQGLDITRRRVDDPGLELVCGDFWKDYQLAPAPLVLCVDAIHHLGDVAEVLRRLRSFVEPGGVLIGNVLTRDNFHEFERTRYGSVKHAWNTVAFLSTALLVRLSSARLTTGAYRTQLRTVADVRALLSITFPEVLDISVDPYFTAFAVRA